MTRDEFTTAVLREANANHETLRAFAGAMYDSDPNAPPFIAVTLWTNRGTEEFWRSLYDDGYRHYLDIQQLIQGGLHVPQHIESEDPPPSLDNPPSEHDTFEATKDLQDRMRDAEYHDDKTAARFYRDDIKDIEREHDQLRKEYEQNQREWERWEKRLEQREAESPEGMCRTRYLRLSARHTGKALWRAFFENTPLTILFDEEPQPVDIPPDLAFSGTYVLAAQGYGKTTLLSKLILDRMNEPCSIIVFDTKPELSLKLQEYVFPKPTVVISPDPQLSLNPFDLGTDNLDIMTGLFSALGAGFTPMQSQALRQIVYLTSKIQGATFDTFVELVMNGGKEYQHIIETFHARERDFWSHYPKSGYTDTRAQLLWRIDLLTPPESLTRAMFGATETKVKMAQLMDTNTLTIIDCTRDILGPAQTEFFGRLFLAMIQGAGDLRARSSVKHPCYVFMDEADTIIANSPNVSEIIYRLRSQRVAFLAAHQSLSQITEHKVQSALADCAIRYVNAKNDAPAMAQSMGMKAEDIRTLRVGEFALSLQGRPAQKIKVPLPAWTYPRASKSHQDERKRRFKENYCYVPKPRSERRTEAVPPGKSETPAPTPQTDINIGDLNAPWKR